MLLLFFILLLFYVFALNICIKKSVHEPLFPGIGSVIEELPGAVRSLVVINPVFPVIGVDKGVRFGIGPQPTFPIEVMPVRKVRNF